jgi:hypothetical protein
MMASIMADHNVEGHFVVLLRLWTSDTWRPVWESLTLEVESFERLGVPHDTSDRELWQLCQQREIVLLTANRNDEGADSLEATIRTLNTPSSLPVLTIADPELVLANRDYAERVAIRILEYLLELDNLRGVGRLFIP